MSTKNVIFSVITLFISLLILEGIAAVILQAKNWADTRIPPVNQQLYTADGIDGPQFHRELETLYSDRVLLEPYRGYALPGDFVGQYVTTDHYGFRTHHQSTANNSAKSIGFFGGSTLFGITSKENDTLPALVASALDPKLAQTYNFGIGAYSSSNELMTFAEVSRLKSYRLQYAVFYDGVNEVGRYLEKLQDPHQNPLYEVIGYPYSSSFYPAARNLIQSTGWQIRYQPALVELWNKVEARFNRNKNVNYVFADDQIEHHAEAIYQIYLNNVLDIDAIAKSRGIQAIFLWQPSLLSITGRNFTASEKSILQAQTVAQKLSVAVDRKVQNSQKLKEVKFFDLSTQLNQLGNQEYFYDYCHVNAAANRVLAAQITTLLTQFLPADHFNQVYE